MNKEKKRKKTKFNAKVEYSMGTEDIEEIKENLFECFS